MSMQPRRSTVLLACAEVVLALTAAHLACRFFRELTTWGRWEKAAHLNFSTGWILMAFACAATLLFRRNWASYGLRARKWPSELNHAINRLATRTRQHPATVWCALGLYLAVCLAFGLENHSISQLAWLIAWTFTATSLGEEFFFRGYVQSRLNETLPRRFQLGGIRFGLGMVIMAFMFGALHSLNSVDYFSGRFIFAWQLAFMTTLSGLVYGFIREASGSITPGVVIHVLSNLFWFTVLPEQTKILLSQ